MELPDDGRVWAYLTVPSDGSYQISYMTTGTGGFTALEIDGESVTVNKTQTLTEGEHLLKFTLQTPATLGAIFRERGYYTKIMLPDSITAIANYTFYNMTSSPEIVMDTTKITSLGQAVFRGGMKLESLYFPNLTSMGASCFYYSRPSGGCRVENLGQITTIPESAFREAYVNLVTIPSTVTSIGNYAFAISSSYRSNLVIRCYAATPPTYGTSAIASAPKAIYVPPASVDTYKSASGWSSYATKIYPLWEEAPIAINHLSIGDFRRRIMAGISTTNRIVPAADGKIWAYYNVTTTESATTLIGATTGIGGTMNVDGVNVTRATSYTFSTIGIHLVKFTPTTTYIGRGVFRNIARIVELYLPSTIIRTDGANDSVNCINSCANLVTIGLSTSFRNAYAQDFKLLSSLTEIKNYEVIRTIGNYAFQSLPNWNVELNLPNLTSLGERAFMNTGITKILNLGSITTIPGGANASNAPFLNCSKLTEATLPATLTTITQFSFYNCAKLKTLTMLATTPPSLGSNAFRGTTALTAIYVPAESVETYKAASGWSYWANIISAIPTT